jgi:hypothetical protein
MAEDLQSKATEMVKKILTVGVGAIFLTEESLRSMVSEFKLPKEFLTGLLDSAGKTKNEFLGKLSSDVLDRIMTRVDAPSLVQEILENNGLDLHVKLSFKPKRKKHAHADLEPANPQSAPSSTDAP